MAIRKDPYRNFRFQVDIDGFDVAGFSRVSGLGQSTEVIKYREGGDNIATRKLIGQTDFPDIVLERGVSEDIDFYYWASAVYNIVADVIPEELVKHMITIRLMDKTRATVKTWVAYNVFPVEFSVSDLDAMSSGVLIERIVLANEGIVQVP